MADELNIITSDANAVNVTTEDRTIIITNDSDNTTVTLSAAETTTVQIATIGPQGPQGPKGDTGSGGGVGAGFPFSGSAVITGSLLISGSGLIVSGGITGSLFGTASYANTASHAPSYTLLTNFNTLTSSFNEFTQSINSWTSSVATTSSLNSLTSSFNEFTQSINSWTSSVATTSSLNSLTSSFNNFTQSINNWTGSVATSASLNTLTSTFNNFTQSINNWTGSVLLTSSFNNWTGSTTSKLLGTASYADNYVETDPKYTSEKSTLATTGSNTFTGKQYINDNSNADSFVSTPAIYTDGGLRVTKNAYVSGTLYVNDLTVYGSQSVQYVTSSQLNISTNLITVNTATPSIRFGGLAVYDSGSTGKTGSLLWDSEHNVWIYTNPSGGYYDGGMLLMGPRSAMAGEEVSINKGYAVVGDGSHHMTSSAIYSSESIIRLEHNTWVTGSLHVSEGITGSFSGSVFGYVTDSTFNTFTSSITNDLPKASSGSVASFGGLPYTSSVSISPAFSNDMYSVMVSGRDARIFTIESQTSASFVINTNSSVALTGPVYWIATSFN